MEISKFETCVKQIKKRRKYPYVDILITYELKNKEMSLDDFFEVNCINNPQIAFRDTQKEKSLIEAINYELIDKKTEYLEVILKHAKSQSQNDKIEYIVSFLEFVKLNLYNHYFSLQKQQKNIPDPSYKYYQDTKFIDKTKDQLNQIQNYIDQLAVNTPIEKVYIYFLDTPATINQKKMIKISISTQKNLEVSKLNSPYIFECNIIGCLEIPNVYFNLNDPLEVELEEMLYNLLPKHVIFVIKGDLKSLQEENIYGRYYRISDEFLEGFKLIAQYIATMKLE